ncbi:TIGR01841 family phasin [Azotobacter chroococcum]|uniref:Phasin family protein n=1 Tax=Azotobacter chroococcum TaxID=353 RepID=A0A4V2Q7F9_9GAMM|nr:TIGR01841 family phasin [Azotobacter chroococcum]TBV99815.1 phasin family protein [Azotobacter chroococcum]TCL31543.1 phasin family protein [Azotobacter chroococcum]
MSIFDSKAFQNGQLSGLDAAQRLGEETIDSGERLVRLQFQALRLASDGFFAGWRRLLSVRGPEAAAELSPAAQAERLLEYGRQVQELAAAGQKVFFDLARQQMDSGTRQLHGMVAEVAKNAPADAEPLVSVLETTAKGVDCLYGRSLKAAGQGVALADNVFRLSREAGRVAAGAVRPKG